MSSGDMWSFEHTAIVPNFIIRLLIKLLATSICAHLLPLFTTVVVDGHNHVQRQQACLMLYACLISTYTACCACA